MKYFKSTNEFLNQFDFESDDIYYDPIHLQDTKVGFSIKRNYPDDIKYKPAISQKGNPDNVVAFWVIYAHREDKDTEITKVPIRVRVANMSLYRMKHFDYDFSDDDSPTQEELERSLSTPKPIDLEYNDEFYYDHENSTFINDAGQTLSGVDILNKVYTEHCDTVHWLKGLKLRTKLFAQSKSTGFISAIVTIIEYILKKGFGRTLEENETISSFFRGYKFDSLKKLNEDSLNVLGYKASKSVIILFCTLVIVGTYLRFKLDLTGGYLSYIGSNNFLSVVHGLFSIWFLDVIAPLLLFGLLNALIKLRAKILFMRFIGP